MPIVRKPVLLTLRKVKLPMTRKSAAPSLFPKLRMILRKTNMSYVPPPVIASCPLLTETAKFDIDIYSDANSKAPVKDLVRSALVPKLRKLFALLVPQLVAEHGKDIQHAPGTNPSAGWKAPTYLPQTGASASTAPVHTSASATGPLVNTTTVTDTEEFRAPATELYKTFTDAQRLAAFTRSPLKVFEGAKVGGKFELFGGNVSGEYLELSEPTKIVQSWRLNQWPAGHFSKLEISFDQNDVDNVTVMRVTWSGVPVGQEEVTKRNWDEYYVRSIKTTFGYVVSCSVRLFAPTCLGARGMI
jgi:activator of HSP90 ATPase